MGIVSVGILVVSTICYCIASLCNFDATSAAEWKNIFFQMSMYGIAIGAATSIVYILRWVITVVIE